MGIFKTVTDASKRAISVVVKLPEKAMNLGMKMKDMAREYKDNFECETYTISVDGKEYEVPAFEDTQIEMDGAIMTTRAAYNEAVGYSKGKKWPDRERSLKCATGRPWRTFVVLCDAEGNELENKSKETITAERKAKRKTQPKPEVKKEEPKHEEKKHTYVGKPTKVPVYDTPEEPKPRKSSKPKRKPVKKPTTKKTGSPYELESADDFYCFATAYRDAFVKMHGRSPACDSTNKMNASCGSKSVQEFTKRSGTAIRCKDCPGNPGYPEELREEYRKMPKYAMWAQACGLKAE